MAVATKEMSGSGKLADGQLVLQNGTRWFRFADPLRVISADRPEAVASCLRELDDAVTQDGLYAAGFMTYEAAAAYRLAVRPPRANALPLLWFGLYAQPELLEALPAGSGTYEVGDWQASLSEEAYREAVEQIKRHIAAGHTYQVNFTMHLRARFSGEPWALFADLCQAQRAAHTAYLDLGRHVICSASPELFFRLNGDALSARPMKGTAERGRTLLEDRAQMALLQASAKDRAENVMIVDMIRNDFGRIADIGSVEVPELFAVERYPTLLQMTSSIAARSRATLAEIMEAAFPCASITGAPKVRTMEIIKDLEREPRGVYTGTIGYWGPDRRASFNVAIRTVVIDRQLGEADYGVGSGIVWDSQAADEYAECRLKSQVLVRRFPNFRLLESLLWTPGEGYFLLEHHLDRLRDSAQYFDYSFDEKAIRHALWRLEKTVIGPTKVRLLLGQDGEIETQVLPVARPGNSAPFRACLAKEPVDSSNIWLYHKTSQRVIYEQALAAAPAGFEVILWNERGEITEALSSNVIVELDGCLFTPPVSSGLLAGTYRRHLLEQGCVQEKTVRIDDLQQDTRLILINSVSKWREAIFVDLDSG